jgi:hypothetical protein
LALISAMPQPVSAPAAIEESWGQLAQITLVAIETIEASSRQPRQLARIPRAVEAAGAPAAGLPWTKSLSSLWASAATP